MLKTKILFDSLKLLAKDGIKLKVTQQYVKECLTMFVQFLWMFIKPA